MNSGALEALLREVRACRLCEPHLPLGPRPVLRADARARVLIVGQAPGTRVHATGVPWNDPSGDRLRDSLQVDPDTFYDQRRTEQDIGDAIAGIVEQDASHFSAGWDRLSLHQRQVLQAIARSGGRNVFAGEFLTTHRLGSHSSVQTSLRQLLKEQVLTKANGEYRFADPFFREWVALRLP